MKGNGIKEFARKLKESIFGGGEPRVSGKNDSSNDQKSSHSTGGQVLTDNFEESKSPDLRKKDTPVIPPRPSPIRKSQRRPHILQVGFDFGTAYSKCIVRNIGTDQASIYFPENIADKGFPFLIPSVLITGKQELWLSDGKPGLNDDGCLSFIKMALANCASGKLSGSFVEGYARHSDSAGMELKEFVNCAGLMFLGSYFGRIEAELKKRFPDLYSNERDRVFANVAIPVDGVNNVDVREVFEHVVGVAWDNRASFTNDGPIALSTLSELLNKPRSQFQNGEEPWYLYPEVSANVQSYVRSRTSKPGLYLFVDTGAGTVDQSVFIYQNPKKRKESGKERLYYLSAQVLELGSSRIEAEAFIRNSGNGSQTIEELRKIKESNRRHDALDAARNTIKEEIEKWTLPVLAKAKNGKLDLPHQIESIELIFGGGGHCRNPYEEGVRATFRSTSFRTKGPYSSRALNPEAIGIPVPSDLEFPRGADRGLWFKRLSVAYGLSFPKYDLSDFVLPDDVPIAKRLPQRRAAFNEFVDKDMV